MSLLVDEIRRDATYLRCIALREQGHSFRYDNAVDFSDLEKFQSGIDSARLLLLGVTGDLAQRMSDGIEYMQGMLFLATRYSMSLESVDALLSEHGVSLTQSS